ncbi:MAG: ATPase [Candidatus Moranbacteria bacterium]|nr:ATPase [Candidatus Moranbacteria bacterium]
MAQVGIREFHGKKIIYQALEKCNEFKKFKQKKLALYNVDNSWQALIKNNQWLKNKHNLVVKPDQLFGKRGKNNLIGIRLNLNQVREWIKQKSAKPIKIGQNQDRLTHFLIEPFVKHEQEFYVSITQRRDCDEIGFSVQGGVEIEKNWKQVKKIKIDLLDFEKDLKAIQRLLVKVDAKNKKIINQFIVQLYKVFKKYHFTFLEINPFTITNQGIEILDLVLKLDDTASFECKNLWGDLEFPVPFGRTISEAEAYIKSLDQKTGASLKLIMLNPKAKIWTMVAGGGASVIYADTITDLKLGQEMANYGEYSGDPTTNETYEYAKTLFSQMIKHKLTGNKALIIGGGIANFTDVAKTFSGIIMALDDFQEAFKQHKVKIFVRRGGPNYEQGLKEIEKAAKEFGLDIEVHGPGTHMTEVVKLALNYIQ